MPPPAAGAARHGHTAAVLGFAALLPIAVVLAVGLGSAAVAPADTAAYLWAALTGGTVEAGELTRYRIVWQIRTPRVLLAALVGAGLAAAGTAMQALVRNPLADPYILGVSSGASVGAVAAGLLGAGGLAVTGGAFAGAVGAAVVVYLAAAGLAPLRLVLTGVAISVGLQAVMSLLVYLVPDGEATGTILFWTMGGFGAASWDVLPVVAVVVAGGIAVLYRLSRGLDVLSLGDETAGALGVDVRGLRLGLFALTALMTGAMVAVSGAIGFAGLVVPHVARLLTGVVHARVLVLAPLLGAVFMVVVDLASRTVAAPRELPVGVITALVGVPLFLVLMHRRR